MPTKMMPASGKPPLARSPIRLRPRRSLQSSVTTIQTTPPPPPGTLNFFFRVGKGGNEKLGSVFFFL